MALWQITDTKDGVLQDRWDDGDAFVPGEEGFSDEKVTAYAGSYNYVYIGTPNWVAPDAPELAVEVAEGVDVPDVVEEASA